MTHHGGTSSHRRTSAGLAAAVLALGTALLAGCAPAGESGSSGSTSASSSTTAAAPASSSAGSSTTTASPASQPASATASPASGTTSPAPTLSPLPAGVDDDLPLPPNETVVGFTTTVAEILGVEGDVSVDTTSASEFAALQADRFTGATATDQTTADVRAEQYPLIERACWDAHADVFQHIAEHGASEVIYGGARPGAPSGIEDTHVQILTFADEADAERTVALMATVDSACQENPDYAEVITAAGAGGEDDGEYRIMIAGPDADDAGLMPGQSVTTRAGQRLITVMFLSEDGSGSDGSEALQAARQVRPAVIEHFGAGQG